ncbi:hypothetical protein Tco_0115399 [Tanacetum coccineum]
MANLKFVDTYNMVTFLSKPAESEGYEQIVDFLNVNPIRYALTINPTIYTSCIKQFWATVKVKTLNGEVQLQALVDGKKIIITKSTVRRDLQLEDVEGVDYLPNATIFEQLALMGPKTTAWNEFSSTMASAIICLATNQKFNFSKYIFENEAVYKELDDSLVRAVTTASSLEAEQDSGNINKTQSKATPNEVGSQGTTLGGGPRRQETMRDTIAQTRFENVSKHSNDPLLARVESSGAKKVWVSRPSKQGRRITDIDDDEDITLVNDQIDADAKMFNVDTLTRDEVLAKQVVAAKDVNLSVDEVTLAQALAALKSVKVQEKGDVIKEPSIPVSTVTASTKDSAATTTTATISNFCLLLQERNVFPEQDKGKGKMIELEKHMKKKDLIRLDEEIVLKLQAKFDKEAKIEADHELAQRLQAQEQEELSDAEKATLFVQLLEKRRKHFAAKRVEEKRNKPPTQAQQRKIMCTYLKNKSFNSIQKMFDRAFKRVNTLVHFRTDLVEGSSKRVGEELEQKSSKKQKWMNKEMQELKSLMESFPDEERGLHLNAIPIGC